SCLVQFAVLPFQFSRCKSSSQETFEEFQMIYKGNEMSTYAIHSMSAIVQPEVPGLLDGQSISQLQSKYQILNKIGGDRLKDILLCLPEQRPFLQRDNSFDESEKVPQIRLIHLKSDSE
ncbi:hypothetical protein NPIL_241811, partial [Nephila pilipes]